MERKVSQESQKSPDLVFLLGRTQMKLSSSASPFEDENEIASPVLDLRTVLVSAMRSCNGVGVMAVVAISGSVVFVSMQMHKRLLSEFMKKIELHLGTAKHYPKKVRFAKDVIEPSSNNKEYRRLGCRTRKSKEDLMLHSSNMETVKKMPSNRLALYRGIIEYRRTLKGNALAFS